MNPFIHLWERPVHTFLLLGYGLLLVSLLVVTLAACWRNAITLRARWAVERPHEWEWDPPLGWLLRVAAIPLVLAIDAWMLGAFVHLFF